MPQVELPQAEFKMVVLGDSNAGKTSLVLRFAEGHYREDARSATVGAFFITKRISTSQGITCKIQIWDTAGQEQFRPMAPMYYRNAAAAIVCYDVTSQKSYQAMREWLDELHRNMAAGSIVLAVAATKNDLVDNVPPEDLVSNEEARELASALGAIFVDTSAKSDTNVHELFRKVAERVLQFRGANKIPVTHGASIDKRGQVVKKNAVVMTQQDTTSTTTTSSATPTKMDQEEQQDIVSEAPKNSSPITPSTICDVAPLMCGILPNPAKERDGAFFCVIS